MTETAITAIVGTICTTAGAAFAAWMAAKGGVRGVAKQVGEVKAQNIIQEKKLNDVHYEINGKLEDLVNAKVKLQLEKAVAEGVEAERQRAEKMQSESKTGDEKQKIIDALLEDKKQTTEKTI